MLLASSISGLFKWRQFEPEVILLAVGWYLRFSLSYRDVEELLAERGLHADHVSVAARVLKSLEVDLAQTRNEILKALDPNFTPPESEAEPPQEGDKKDVKTPALRAFGRALTELAKQGGLDPVIGRKIEIERR